MYQKYFTQVVDNILCNSNNIHIARQMRLSPLSGLRPRHFSRLSIVERYLFAHIKSSTKKAVHVIFQESSSSNKSNEFVH
jgi:hypothetical protein